jgi:hypothetical protein
MCYYVLGWFVWLRFGTISSFFQNLSPLIMQFPSTSSYLISLRSKLSMQPHVTKVDEVWISVSLYHQISNVWNICQWSTLIDSM